MKPARMRPALGHDWDGVETDGAQARHCLNHGCCARMFGVNEYRFFQRDWVVAWRNIRTLSDWRRCYGTPAK